MCAVSMKGGGWFSLPGLLTDLQLSLNASLAALPVVRLRGIVFWHHLDKLTGQCGVLEIQWGTTKHFAITCSMAAVDTNLLGSLKWTGGVPTVIDSQCSGPFPSIYFFLKVISRMDFSVFCWQRLLSLNTLHGGKTSCSQLWRLKKINCSKYWQSIRKILANKIFFFSFGINWQWHSKLAVWLISIVLCPVCTQWQYTHTKIYFKQYTTTISIMPVYMVSMRYVIAVVSASLSSWPYCTCVFRILRSADDLFWPSSCSMVCWIPKKYKNIH